MILVVSSIHIIEIQVANTSVIIFKKNSLQNINKSKIYTEKKIHILNLYLQNH